MKKLLTLAMVLTLTTPSLADEMKMEMEGHDHGAMMLEQTQKMEQTEKEDKKILYWVAPMDPEYRRDKPGKSPMGMDLVPVYEETKSDTKEDHKDDGHAH